MAKDLKVAILGATGAVGQELLGLIEERKFPYTELKLLSSSRSAGKKISFQGQTLTVQEAGEDSFQGVDLVLSSAGGKISKALAPVAVKAGALVVDNTSAFRMDPKVPLVVPEINPEDILKHEGIIANPNCSTIIMLVPLFPLHRAAGIRRIVAATYQAASGAGAMAMEELRTQAQEILEGKMPTRKAFPHQIAFNLFSHNSAVGEDLFCEEEIKMIRESKKIFHNDDLRVIATTIRVPVMRAHAEALFVEFEKDLSVAQAREILSSAPGVRLVDDAKSNHFPMPIEAENKDPILVGRLRKDPSQEKSLALFVCGDQIRKGAALNALQIAEYWLPHRAVK